VHISVYLEHFSSSRLAMAAATDATETASPPCDLTMPSMKVTSSASLMPKARPGGVQRMSGPCRNGFCDCACEQTSRCAFQTAAGHW
jgi:hypothetical protein